MKKIDFTALDGRSLRTFLAVLEEASISRAAARLGVTQSAVSHLLDKLRLVLGDPLFVREGRGISPTSRAVALREPIQQVLDDLKGLTDERVFDPLVGQYEFTIAANDFQRDLVFPGFLRDIHSEGVNAYFRFIPSGVPAADLLQQARCQLIVTPYPPEGADIYQSRLFDDRLVCFYDVEVRDAPTTKKAFCAADFVEVRFGDDETGLKNLADVEGLVLRKPRIAVPNFSALAGFLKGTDLITTQANLMDRVHLAGFRSAALPFNTQPISMFMVWHRRDHNDPAHQWLRRRIQAFTQRCLDIT